MRRGRWLLTLVIVSVLFPAIQLQPAFAAGVVGDGSPGSCTDAALTAALVGGGLVSFDCGPNPITITVLEKTIAADTQIDGGGW